MAASRTWPGAPTFRGVADDESEPEPPTPHSIREDDVAGVLKTHQVEYLKKHSRKFKGQLSNRSIVEHDAQHGGGHGHDREPALATALASALINYLLMFGLCCAYGMIMFYDDYNSRHRGLGVKMNLSTALILGLLLAIRSKVPVAIGGPDLNPVVFLGGMIETLSKSIADELGLELDGRRLGGGGAATSTFCVVGGEHEAAHRYECEEYHLRLQATATFTVAVSSAILGLVFFVMGRWRLTKLVTFVPSSVMEAFLSCVGYKVFNYALKFCNYDIKQFAPAAAIGVPLYFMKAYHVGNPAIVMPLGLLVPLILFYVLIYAAGWDVDKARQEEFFFPVLPDCQFWEIWTGFIPYVDKVSISAWLETIVDLLIMVIVCILDCLLKISSTESKLPVKCQKDFEIQLHGIGNIGTVLCGSTVGYMQLKFNVINFGVMGNVTDRRGGIFYAILCGVCFFGPIKHFDYLPRFFLSSLLFFAGSGFVAENLWGSRKFLTFSEWVEILMILGVFVLSKQLLSAVMVGIFLTCIRFIMKYSTVPAIQGTPLDGSEIQTRERWPELVQVSMRHIIGSWVRVVRLRGFLFFASAHKLTTYLNGITDEQHRLEVPAYQKLRAVILECELLEGMDASAAKSLRKLLSDMHEKDVRVIWTGVAPELKEEMITRDLLKRGKGSEDVLQKTEHAILIMQHQVLHYMVKIQRQWLQIHPALERHHRMIMESEAFEPFQDMFMESDGARFGCPWQYCSRLKLQAHQTLLWQAGDLKRILYLIHSGAVGLFSKTALEGEKSETNTPIAVYRHGQFLNCEFFLRAPQKYTAVALEDGELLYWDEELWYRLKRRHHLMHAELHRAAIAQQVRDVEARGRRFGSHLEEKAKEAEEEGTARLSRRNSGEGINGLKQSASLLDATREQVNKLPKELQETCLRIGCALSLSQLGFFDEVTQSELAGLPDIPNCIRNDLRVAFHTYAKSTYDCDVIDCKNVHTALMYAGLFNVILHEHDSQRLTEDEFIEVGREVAMAPLSRKNVDTIAAMFTNFDKDGNGELASDELAKGFRAYIRRVSVEMVDDIAMAWHSQSDSTSKHHDSYHAAAAFDIHSFTSIMSRYIRKHEHYWNLVNGFSELLGTDLSAGRFLQEDFWLSHEQLLKNKYLSLSPEQAQEMLWAAGWHTSHEQHGKGVDFLSLLSITSLVLENVQDALPPQPILSDRWGHKLLHSRKVGGDMPSERTPVARRRNDVVVDFRIEKHFTSTTSKSHSFSDLTKPLTEDSELHVGLYENSSRSSVSSLENGKTFAATLHLILEEPDSSKIAAGVSAYMGALIVMSVATLVMEPIISPQDKVKTPDEAAFWTGMELFFTVTFTVEYLLRFLVCDALGKTTKSEFLVRPPNVCDVLAVVPTYVDLCMDETDTQSLRLLRMIRLFRLSRMARIARLANKTTLAAPVAMVLVVIWGIYMKQHLE